MLLTAACLASRHLSAGLFLERAIFCRARCSWGESVRICALCQTTERRLSQQEAVNRIISVSLLNVQLVRGSWKKTERDSQYNHAAVTAGIMNPKDRDFTQIQKKRRKSTSTTYAKYFGQHYVWLNQPHPLFGFIGHCGPRWLPAQQMASQWAKGPAFDQYTEICSREIPLNTLTFFSFFFYTEIWEHGDVAKSGSDTARTQDCK